MIALRSEPVAPALRVFLRRVGPSSAGLRWWARLACALTRVAVAAAAGESRALSRFRRRHRALKMLRQVGRGLAIGGMAAPALSRSASVLSTGAAAAAARLVSICNLLLLKTGTLNGDGRLRHEGGG